MDTDSVPEPKPPTTRPQADIQYVIRMLAFHFHDEGAEARGMPEGVRGMELAWDFRRLFRKPPQGVGDLRRRTSSGMSPLELTFDDEKRGKELYFCMRWEGTDGLKGPWTELSSAFIP
jgi:hypothetical protein